MKRILLPISRTVDRVCEHSEDSITLAYGVSIAPGQVFAPVY